MQPTAIGCCAISEPNAGSDIMSMCTYASRVDNGYLLQGEKCWITNAPYADYAIVYAKITNAKNRDISVYRRLQSAKRLQKQPY